MNGMMILLVCGFIILLTLYFNLKKEIKYLTAQIKKSKGQYTSLRVKSINKDIETLANQINELYNQSQQERVNFRQKEEHLRQSITNISHDLRTPLTSMKGYMQLIEEPTTTREQKQQYIAIVKKRTETLQELIEAFYDLCRIEEKEYPFQFSTIQLDELLCQTLVMFYEEFTVKGIEPVVYVEEHVSTFISDKQVVSRIFSNVIINMLRHGEAPIEISLKQNGNIIITEFRNYAPQLTNENVEKLFERFYSGDVSRNSGSSGLGLSITKAFVHQLGHEIEAFLESEMLCIRIVWQVNRK